MRHIVHKWFWVWDFDKEEKWLNEMASKGLALIGTGFCKYEFEECTPGEYTFRIELLENHLGHPESQRYIQFLEDTGVEQVGSYMRWCYFRKKQVDGQFDLFSDFDSRIRHLNRIQLLVLPVMLLNLLNALNWFHLYWSYYRPSELFFLGLLFLLIIGILAYAWGRLQMKKNKLKKEREISEN